MALQACMNLLDNAIKYSPVRTAIEIEVLELEHSVRIEFRDQGEGVDPIHHSRLFERFYRVDKARSRESGGTGLGLSIVKHIMILHGGQVGLRSVVGQGSTFYLDFPRGNAGFAEDA
jgi:signal transduction histidine kinase